MRDDLDIELAELYPERRSDEAALAALRDRLFAEPPRRRSWIGATAVASVVLLVLVGVAFLEWPRPVPSLSPVQSLTEAADRLDASPDPAGDFRHVTQRIWRARTVELPAGRWYTYSEAFLVEIWIPTAPNQEVREARRATGEVRWVGGTEPESVLASRPAPELPASYASLCPRSPCGLPQLPDSPGEWLSMRGQHEIFEDVWPKLSQPANRTHIQADYYRLLAKLPDVRYAGDRIVLDTQLGGGRLRLKVDPATGHFLGYERLVENPSRLPADTILESVDITVDAAAP